MPMLKLHHSAQPSCIHFGMLASSNHVKVLLDVSQGNSSILIGVY